MNVTDYLDRSITEGTEQRVSLEGFLGIQFPEDTLSVSNEGLSEMLAAVKNVFFSGKPSVSNLSGGWFDRMSVLRQTMGKTYMDPNWLSRRGFTEGMVKSAKFGPLLSSNGAWSQDLNVRMEEAIRVLSVIREYYYGITIGWYDEIYPLIKDLNGDNTFTYSDAFRLERHVARLDYPEFKFVHRVALGGATITPSQVGLAPVRFVNVEALDKVQVVNLCQIMLAMADEFDRYNQTVQEIWNHRCYQRLRQLISATAPGADGENENPVHAELNRVFNTMSVFDIEQVKPQFAWMASILKACAQYIDASVK